MCGVLSTFFCAVLISQDGLFLICQEPEIITSYSKAILTPNAGEFPRLYQKVVRFIRGFLNLNVQWDPS